MATVLLSIAVLGIFVLLMGMRLILVPGSRLRGTCASNSPYLEDELDGCGACGKKGESEIEACEYRDSPGRLLLDQFRKSR